MKTLAITGAAGARIARKIAEAARNETACNKESPRRSRRRRRLSYWRNVREKWQRKLELLRAAVGANL